MIIKIRKIAKSNQTRKRLAFVILTLIGLICIAFFIFRTYKQDAEFVENTKIQEQNIKEKKFLVLLKKGDSWFEESKWDGELFYYKKAKAIYQNKYSIDYRIAQTMSLKCQYEYLECRETKALLDSLYLRYPQKEKELNTIKYRLDYEY